MTNEKLKKSQGTNMTQQKPNKIYQDTSFKKTDYTKTIESKINSILVVNFSYQKLVNTTLKTLSKLNPLHHIEEIDYLIETLFNITNIKELVETMKLINLKLKNMLKPSNDVQKLPMISSKTLNKENLNEVLFQFKDLPKNKFFKIFYSLSLLTYTKDISSIMRVNSLFQIDQCFETIENKGYKIMVDYILKNHTYLTFDVSSIKHLYPYGGGKQKFYESINNHFKHVITTSTISKVVDPFMGGLGSFYSLFNLIHQNRDTISVVLNDINPSIYHLNKDVQSPSGYKKMMFYISNIVQEMFVKYQTYKPSVDEYREYHKMLLKKLNHIEKNRTPQNSIEGSSLLLFLINNGFGGNYEMKDNGSSISPSTDIHKVNRFFNFVGKIQFYHYLFTSVNVKFENKDYKDILKKYSRHEDTFTTMDPPYFQTNTMSIEEYDSEVNRLEKLIKSTSNNNKELESLKKELYNLSCGCVYNYGNFGNNFPHEQLLKNLTLIKGELNYFNYRHPIIEKYSNKYGLSIQYLERKSTNGRNIKGVPREVKEETFMTGKINISNQREKEIHETMNNVEFVGTMIQKVS